MPFNGAGVFNRLYSWVQDAANGIKIRADRMDNEMNGMATGLTDCVTRDGQSPWLDDLPAAGHKLTGLGAAQNAGDALSLGAIFQAYLSADQAATPGSYEKVLLDTVSVDTAGGWDPANNWYVVKVAGWHRISGALTWKNSSVAGASQIANITKNGLSGGSGVILLSADTLITSSEAGQGSTGLPTAFVELSVGDTLELDGNVNGTAPMFFSGSPTVLASYMAIEWISSL